MTKMPTGIEALELRFAVLQGKTAGCIAIGLISTAVDRTTRRASTALLLLAEDVDGFVEALAWNQLNRQAAFHPSAWIGVRRRSRLRRNQRSSCINENRAWGSTSG